MFTPMHAISAAALALSLSAFAYAAEVSPADSTPAPVQEEPRDTTRVPADDQAKPGMSQEDYDMVRGGEVDRDTVLKRTGAVALPEKDPVFGVNGPLLERWSESC